MNMEIGSTAQVRELNQEVIMATLRNRESASIADLAKLVDLSVATCVKIVGGLVESGEIEEVGERDSRGGRPARHYRFNPGHSLIAALILRVTEKAEYIDYFIADANGTLLHSGRTAPAPLDIDAIDSLLESLKKDYPSLKAVSVSIPGTVTEGVIGPADAPALVGVHIEDHIRKRHNLGTSVENDMNFAALGYYRCNLSSDGLDFAYLLFPRGGPAGGGLVINDKLVRGKSGFAGELSYLTPTAQRGHSKRILSMSRVDREYVEYVARMVTAVTVLINPAVIVLSGDNLEEDAHSAILSACVKDIPAEHLPEIIIKQDYNDDCLTGMIVQALSSLTRYPHLLQFSPVSLVQYRTAE